jgi:hypothetical protein
MSDAFDNLIDRQSPPDDPARVPAVVASDQRFAYFGTSAFAIRLEIWTVRSGDLPHPSARHCHLVSIGSGPIGG